MVQWGCKLEPETTQDMEHSVLLLLLLFFFFLKKGRQCQAERESPQPQNTKL